MTDCEDLPGLADLSIPLRPRRRLVLRTVARRGPQLQRRLLADANLVSLGEVASELRVGRNKARALVEGLPSFAGGRCELWEWGAVKARVLGGDPAAAPASSPTTASTTAPPCYRGPRARL
jgi:hypothetical protein